MIFVGRMHILVDIINKVRPYRVVVAYGSHCRVLALS
jgi:hypothetical protein